MTATVAVAPRKYAVKTQPRNCAPWRSWMMWGSAVETTVWSSADRTAASERALRAARNLGSRKLGEMAVALY
jgi:hypothetical protein